MGAGETGNYRKYKRSVWWNDDIKAVVRRKEAPSYQEAKKRCMEAYKQEKRKVKGCIYQGKKKVNVQFGRKMNDDVNGNRKLFWKEMSNAKGGKG